MHFSTKDIEECANSVQYSVMKKLQGLTGLIIRRASLCFHSGFPSSIWLCKGLPSGYEAELDIYSRAPILTVRSSV